MRPARLTVPALATSVLLALGTTAATAAPYAPAKAQRVTSSTTAATAVTTARLAGANRYATSVAISKANFAAPQEVVVVASGLNFPDALGAGPFAALVEAPLLLVPTSGKLPVETAAELDRLKTQTVVVVGGPSSVNADMVRQLEVHTANKVAYQVDGANRYDTAAQLTEGFSPALTGVPVYLASGTTFPDALGGGGAASLSGGFLLLTSPTKLPAETTAALKRVKPSDVIVLGGPSSISNTVLSQVRTAVGSRVPVTRIGGSNRFATAAMASADTLTSAREVLLTNGMQYPDALSGAATAPYFGGRPVLLTRAECVPAETLAEIKRLGATKVTALGGPSVVSDAALRLKAC
ncbi:MAG: cell wall-binding repeat-containing protein [Pedococcus sp.]